MSHLMYLFPLRLCTEAHSCNLHSFFFFELHCGQWVDLGDYERDCVEADFDH